MKLNFDYPKKNLIFLALILALFSIIGFLIGYFSAASGTNDYKPNKSKQYLEFLTNDSDDQLYLEYVKENINIDNIQKHLK